MMLTPTLLTAAYSPFPTPAAFPPPSLHSSFPSISRTLTINRPNPNPILSALPPHSHRLSPPFSLPHTTREFDAHPIPNAPPGSTTTPVRERFQRMILDVQDSVCAAIEAVEGGAKFKQDEWSRPGGGGGISRVLQDGAVWEKAGVNVSIIHGVMPPEAYRSVKPPTGNGDPNPGHVPFFAAGISSVLHPKNPFAPTLHFNYRYFETDAPKDAPGAPRQWWFGGGTDLTPSYIFEEDVKHFHSVQKTACDKFNTEFYPQFKRWCDDYFHIKHRGERRGVGGIFFDDLNLYDQELLLSFATECANSVVPAYIPIIEKRKDMPFSDQHKAWQQLRRGRYVEFNLVYDRGTKFGLETSGRIESILVSLPLTARWEYNHQPEEGTEEWKLLDACINPKEWV